MKDFQTHIVVRGAREHNLKNISINIPKNSFVVITGLSGSGKSSLAFDTVFAEGQRRYVESLSSYARQFLDQLKKPDVDSIDGLCPAVSIEQKTTNQSPRSTVGTITEIYDFARLLWAKVGKPVSSTSGKEFASQSPAQILERVMALPEGERLIILAPLVIARKGEHAQLIEKARKSGFSKIKINKDALDIFDDIKIDKNKKNNISLIIDQLTLKPENRARIGKAIDQAIKQTGASVIVESIDASGLKQFLYTTGLSDPDTGISLPSPEPRLFSFNSPVGACSHCNGLGYKTEFDPSLLVNDSEISILEGALETYTGKSAPGKPSHEMQTLVGLAKHLKFDINLPFSALPKKIRTVLFSGSGKEEVHFQFKGSTSNYKTKKTFPGIVKELEKKEREFGPDGSDYYDQYKARLPCEDCGGARLRPEALAFKIDGKSIVDACTLPMNECLTYFKSLRFEGNDASLGNPLVKEICHRLSFLIDVGLDYLDISRSAATLSGGEMQRVRLATQIGAPLVGVLYVLDEPSIGLHQRDNAKLINSLKLLRDRGNSVIVVEHDRDTIEASDYVIDMGPGAGTLGGNIIASGTPKSIVETKSITGSFLRGTNMIPLPKNRREIDWENTVSVNGCTGNNLKNVSAKFPLGKFICVSGVSGSGKSTLIFETLIPAICNEIYRSERKVAPFASITGADKIDKVVHVDQSPIGRSPRSNPATYTGVFTQIRTIFAETVDAKIRGYGIGRFSFNVSGGRCDVCEGDGAIKVEMHFLPDVYVPCHSCNGIRYNRETLAVKYKGKSIADVLSMPIEEAHGLFKNVPTIEKYLKVLLDVGLGYVTLGQSATTLSGGEAQRIKLSKELSKRPTGKTFYVLDEPSTGLHFQDITMLLSVLHRLVDNGNTVLVIEHNLDILKHADVILDLGPEGGRGGGQIVASGTPEEVAKSKNSYTGKFLQDYI